MRQLFLIVVNSVRQLMALLLLGCGLVHSAAATDPVVVIVASERSASYMEAVQAVEDGLVQAGLGRSEIQTVALTDSGFSPATSTARLVVAVGTKASAWAAAKDNKTPIIATLLPLSGFEQVASAQDRKIAPSMSGVCIDQPVSRQLELIRLALPLARRVGILWGSDAPAQNPRLSTAAQARGLQVVSAQVGNGQSIFQALARVLEEADVLLAVANPQIYSSSSIQNILLASFRAKVPMVGFSPAYVQAGAAFSLYSTPAMMGRQTATLAWKFLQGKPLAGHPYYPSEFEVGVNHQVARSLGLSLDASNLTERLRQLEPVP